MTFPTAQEFDDAKVDIDDLEAIVNGSATVTTRLGGAKQSILQILSSLGYQNPVAYAGSISFTTGLQTIERSGIIYAPLIASLPFTTSGTWTADDENKFHTIAQDDAGIEAALGRHLVQKQYRYHSTAASSSHAGISAGYVVKGQFYDGNNIGGSGAVFSFTGTTTAGKAGDWPNVDGFFYDADGKAFEIIGSVKHAKQFGAVGSGDETAIFNAILAALNDNDTLLLDGGATYLVDNLTALTNRSNITIKGNGATLKANPATATGYCLEFDTCTGIRVEGVVFDRQNSYRSGVILSGIFIDDSVETVISRCDFSECNEGVRVGGLDLLSKSTLVEYCTMTSRLAYSVANLTNEVLCEWLLNVQSGLGFHTAQGNITNGIRHLVQFAGSDSPNSKAISNNAIDGYDSQIYMSSDNCHAIGNLVVNAGKDGIKVNNSSVAVKNSVIADNIVLGSGVHQTDGGLGINIQGSNSTCTGNTSKLLPAASVVVSNVVGISVNGSNNVVSNNTIVGSSDTLLFGQGIIIRKSSLNDPANNNLIDGNITRDCINGIVLSVITGAEIADNVISNNKILNATVGISGDNQTGNAALATRNILKDNVIDTCSQDGFRCRNHQTLDILDTILRNITNYPIQTGGCSNLSIARNRSDGTGIAFYREDSANTTTQLFVDNYSGDALKDRIEEFIDPNSGNINIVGVTNVRVQSGARALALPDGTHTGQVKLISASQVSGGGTLVVTPANLAGATTGTFNAANQLWRLVWNGAAWDSEFATCAVA